MVKLVYKVGGRHAAVLVTEFAELEDDSEVSESEVVINYTCTEVQR